MDDKRTPVRWDAQRRARRGATLVAAALVHVAVLLALVERRMQVDVDRVGPVVETTIWTPSIARPVARPVARTEPGIAAPRLPGRASTEPVRRPVDGVVAVPTSPRPLPTTASPSAITLPQPPASAASGPPAPLRLTLTREQLRSLEASTGATLAQSVPREAKASPFDTLAGDDAEMQEILLPQGVTEVHLHGACFRLVPTPRAQADPFNHGNERLTGPCIPNF